MSQSRVDPPASSSSDSDWETDESESRPTAPRNSDRRGNTTTRRRQHGRGMAPPSFDMSPFGDSALSDFMYGLEANGFGSMLRESGIPPLLGPEYVDFSDEVDSDDEEDSSGDEAERRYEKGAAS
jgi:hypothetical protein